MSNSVIELRDCTKTIKGQTVLRHINAQFEKGICYGVVGRNGSGKSMLFKAICGFVQLTAGEITVHGQTVGRQVDYPDDLGFVIEAPGFIPNLNGFMNLKLLASLRQRADTRALQGAMKDVGLDPLDRRPVRKYSTGMRQRLALAQAFMEDPSLLLLDEPMNGIDKEGVEAVTQLLLRQKARGKTLLLTSHIPGDLESLCDVLLQMEEGALSPLSSSAPPGD